MSAWQAAVGALVGGGLGYLGGRISPRWLEKPPRSWEPYAAAVVNGVLAGLLAYGHGLDRYFWWHLLFLSILTTASLVDFHDRIIPNELVILGLVIGSVSLLLPYPDKTWLQALSGAAAGFGFLLLLALLVKGGMGMGDVKLAAVIGLFLGIKWVAMGLVFAFLAGGLVGGLLMLLRIVGRKDAIPFGPWLALGAAITSLYGAQIWAWYYPY